MPDFTRQEGSSLVGFMAGALLPLGGGPWPGVVLIHHMPGWDEWIKEATRKLAHHGLATIAPHLYFREGPGSPDDVGARVRAAGGVALERCTPVFM